MKKTPLYLIVLIPVLMIVVIAIGVLLQQRKYLPTQEFLYAKGAYMHGGCEQLIKAELLGTPPPLFTKTLNPAECADTISLFVYNFATQSSKPVTVVQAKLFSFTRNALRANDGFYILPTCYTDASTFLFPLFGNASGEGYRTLCLTRGHYQKSIDIYHDRDSFVDFIAWIEEK